MKKTYISEIQNFCVHDGPGIRTTVFFQGCPMRCKWCQNPETISAVPVLMYNPNLCGGCGACIEACPDKAISIVDGRLKTDSKSCKLCGECVSQCYFLARTFSSKQMTVEEVFNNVMKEAVTFRRSGGGLTISGGEPLMQVAFITELLERVRGEGISTAVETAGFVPRAAFYEIHDKVDTFLYDMKMYDEVKHKHWTGVSNKTIKQNLKFITDIHDNVVIRIPLIPGVNDTDEEFGSMMRFVKELRKINSIHILPFHNAGAGKYDLLGAEYTLLDLNENNDERVQACREMAEQSGFRVSVGGTGFLDDKKNRVDTISWAARRTC